MPIKGDVTTLIAGLQNSNPRLHQAITLIMGQLDSIDAELHPRTTSGSAPSGSVLTDAIVSPGDFVITSTGPTTRLSWSAATGAFQYEIRKGTDWDTANFITKTPALRADVDPLLYGTHVYLIKSITIGGAYSSTTTQANFVVSQIPPVSINPNAIDNNVLLYWNVPTSIYTISQYRLDRDGVLVGYVNSTFTSFFEMIAATYSYSITAIDVAGNEGTTSTLDVAVRTPPDYALQDSFVSSLTGTRVNTLLRPGPVLLCDWTSETYHAHFVGRGYATWQAKIDAGFPIYIQPAATTGSYEERIDFGILVNNIIVTVLYNTNAITPLDLVTIVVKISVSDDDITYSAYVAGSVQFYSHFRYVKIKLEFSGSNKALMELSTLTVNIDVKRENDGGEVAALSTDVAGTAVLFNKAFKDIESITVAVLSTTEPYKAIYLFTDIPNPTTFYVMVFDTTGARVSKTVSWKARGIV